VEVVIAVALVGGLLVWADSVPPHTLFPTKWVGLIVYTAAAFGDTLQWCKRYWRVARFWLAFTALLLLHSVIFALILVRVREWPLFWFVPVAIAEFPLLRFILSTVGKGTAKGVWEGSGPVSRAE
jgi:hypothetical protein